MRVIPKNPINDAQTAENLLLEMKEGGVITLRNDNAGTFLIRFTPGSIFWKLYELQILPEGKKRWERCGYGIDDKVVYMLQMNELVEVS